MIIIGVLIFASTLSFGLGYLAGLDASSSVDPGQGSAAVFEDSPIATTSSTGQVIASKSGTKYYLPTCAGASRISDANKIYFNSAELARAAGYSPAANCDGI